MDTLIFVDFPRLTFWDTVFSECQKYITSNPEFVQELKIFNQYRFHYTPIPRPMPVDFALDGYFQSYKYFIGQQDKIYRKLDFGKKQKAIIAQFAESYLSVENKRLVSMHFRWGDYKEKQYYHPILTVEYYKKALLALNLASGDHEGVRILTFCEEPDRVQIEKEILSVLKTAPELADLNIEYCAVSAQIPDWQQMFLMSCCDCFVIANSSFSWWGAYLGTTLNNATLDKQVCYPQGWFGPGLCENYTGDMFPENWICIR